MEVKFFQQLCVQGTQTRTPTLPVLLVGYMTVITVNTLERAGSNLA